MNTYRKTQNDEWVVSGDPADIKPGATVTVKTKSGKEKTETIVSIGTPFVNDDGEERVYGYLRPEATEASATESIYAEEQAADRQSWESEQ